MVQVRQRREVLPHHQRFPERKKASTSEPSKPPTPKSKDVPIGSIPDFKRVEEIWDKATSKFKTREAVVEKGIDELDQYAFVVRTRTDMPSLKQSVTVRVNSDFIRKALRHVMGVAKAIGLQEDKPIIDQKLLYNFLPDLKRYEAKAAGAFEDELKHISLFVNFIAHTYQPVTQQLLPQLKAGQIAWDLLGTVMKPGCILYATCFGTGKPRCVVLNTVEQKKHTQVLSIMNSTAAILTVTENRWEDLVFT
ncbi:hypothetical protein LOZ51_001310 [Ophidiomyces ophidiicola]|nr:hypothetical protein LOZ54_002711 [Ophidiomyces ophidiicola]KAI2001019.1 hypothetical protein LOZ51_001310 [Ophidiomyces ophidiicola]